MKIIAVLLCSILIFGATNAQNDTTKTTTSTSTTPSTSTSTSTTTAPSTTSPASTTSTTAGPSTTSLPPVPENHKWFVNETNHTCIIVQMTVTLNIAVNITSNTIKKEILIPVNETSVTTNCSEGSEQFMKLSWKPTEKKTGSDNSIVIYFKKSDKSFALDHFTVEIAPEEFPQANRSGVIKLMHVIPHYNTSFGCSYRVSKKQEFNLTNESDKLATGYLDVVDLQFQAFRKDSTPYFAEVCDFETPDVVPIAVGCVLAGLVVIVLAAYLINRKRSQARGYLSM